jgi:hypothetical protein
MKEMDRVGLFEPTTSINTLQQSKKKDEAGELLFSQYIPVEMLCR